MLKRVLGFVMLLIGLVGVAVSIFGAMAAQDVVENIGSGIDESLSLVSDSLATVKDTLAVSSELVGKVSDTLATVDQAAVDLSDTVDETRPLIEQVGLITSSDVPDGIEAVQETIPNLAEVAGTIDDTLTALSNFEVDERILGVAIQFDLGVDYAPSVPFDESILQIGQSLEGLPERLRGLESYLATTDDNLDQISQNVSALATDLREINSTVEDVHPLLDDYSRVVTEVNDGLRLARANLSDQVDGIKRGILLVFLWIGLAQAAPLYLGFELLRGKELSDEDKLVRRDEIPDAAEGAAEELPAQAERAAESTQPEELAPEPDPDDGSREAGDGR